MRKVMVKPGADDFVITRDEARALIRLCDDIEQMAMGVTFSDTAWTPQRTVHISFVNGVALSEGSVQPEPLALETCAEMTLAAVRAYRDSIPEDVGLVWRVEPELRRSDMGYTIRTRLCFEPTSWSKTHLLEERIEDLQRQLAEARRPVVNKSFGSVSGEADTSVLLS